MRGCRRGIAVGVGLATGIAVALPATATATAARSARVQGTFTMHAVVTRAVGIRGEHRGERVTRTWWIRPAGCRRDSCRTLRLRRALSGGRVDQLLLHRRANGTYVGSGAFFVALACRGRVHQRGSRARYTIRLRVTATRTVGGIRFARRLRARYVNTARSDDTSCSVQPSRDAADYSGRRRGRFPRPPRPAFSTVAGAGGVIQFSDASRSGSGPGRRIRRWRWSFGDPASGPANRSGSRDALHAFSAPGVYRVALTVTDAAGLHATVARSVTVPAPAAPQLRRRSGA